MFRFFGYIFLLCGLSFSGELIPLTVSGTSMVPTLSPNQTVYLDTSAFESRTPQRDELVAIQFSRRENLMVKRVLAVPGDTVIIENESVTVNGIPLLCEEQLRTSTVLKIQLKRYNNTLPQNTLLVMGDNCDQSLDSGEYGLISHSQIVGKIETNSKR